MWGEAGSGRLAYWENPVFPGKPLSGGTIGSGGAGYNASGDVIFLTAVGGTTYGQAAVLVTSVGALGAVTGFTVYHGGGFDPASLPTGFTQDFSTSGGTGFTISAPTFGPLPTGPQHLLTVGAHPVIQWAADDPGTIVAVGQDGPSALHATRWDGTAATTLPEIGGGDTTDSRAFGCNPDASVVVGWSYDGAFTQWPVRWDGSNVLTVLPTIADISDGFQGEAWGISRDSSIIFGIIDLPTTTPTDYSDYHICPTDGVPPPPPPTPSCGVSFTNSVTFTWTAVAGATSYDVFWQALPFGSITESSTTSTSLTISAGVTPSTRYQWDVQALFGDGSSTTLSSVQICPSQPWPPPPPPPPPVPPTPPVPFANLAYYQDTGQGAAGRIASWSAYTEDHAIPVAADNQPVLYLRHPEETIILRTDDNAGAGGIRVPLGTGGCGEWRPILDGSSAPPTGGAVSGGDNCFFVNQDMDQVK